MANNNSTPVGTTVVWGSNHMPVPGSSTPPGGSSGGSSGGSNGGSGGVQNTPWMPSDGPRQTNTPPPGKSTTAQNQTPQAPGNQYTVKAGDTLSAIAKAQGVNMGDITGYRSGDPNKIFAGENLSIGAKYKQGLDQANQNGTEAPNNSAEGSAGVKSLVPPTPTVDPALTQIDKSVQEDPGIQSLLDEKKQYDEAQSQRETLTQEYQRLTSEAGLTQLNTDLMNMKNVINGTEDDIRNEVTKAGGFATNSQVLALTSARNKVMIQNYNNLLETKQQAVDNINQMMTLDQKDREYAANKFSTDMQFDQQIMDMRDKMHSNAQASYQKIVDQVGYAGLEKMTGGDPYYTNLVEQTLGLGKGGLASLASYTPPTSELDKLKLEGQRLNNQGQILQNQKLSNDLNGTGPDNNPITPDAHATGITQAAGISLQAFNYLTQGTASMSRMPVAQRNQIMKETNDFLNKNGLDVATFQSQYKSYNDVLQKNIERANQTKIFAGEVSGTVDQFVNDIGSDIGNLKVSNVAKLFAGKQVNDPSVQKYAFNLQTMRNDLAGYYAASRGTSQPDDSDLRSAESVIMNGLNSKSASAFKDSINSNEQKVTNVVNTAVDSAQQQVWGLFGVGGQYKNKNQLPQQTQNLQLYKPEEIPSGYYQASDGLLYKK